MRRTALLLIGLLLAGCDRLSGAADQLVADAEAIGYACRVSRKAPEACMKENEAQSPSSILAGWKSADEDIKAGKLDPTMGDAAKPEGEAETAPAAADAPAEEMAAPAEDKPGEPPKE